MVTIFAARHQSGAIRYIADVPRGSACECACLVCGSPLVAKQGEVNDWHFAHEGGQERPECPAGAVNLLRRIAAEELKRLAWRVSAYTIPNPVPGRPMLSWNDQPAGDIAVADEPGGPMDEAASVPLVTCGKASIYVVIGRERAPEGGDGPSLRVLVPLPEAVAIRSEEDARAFVRASMRVEWIYLPDFKGLLAAARREADELARAAEAARLHAERLRRSEAGSRWASLCRAMTAHAPGTSVQRPAPPPPASTRTTSGLERPQVAWAPGLAGAGSIQYRRLDDGTQWVYYPAGSAWRLAPVPDAFDGWDEYFPAKLAVVEDARSLRVVDELQLLLWFAKHTRESLIDSDPRVIAQRFTARRS